MTSVVDEARSCMIFSPYKLGKIQICSEIVVDSETHHGIKDIQHKTSLKDLTTRFKSKCVEYTVLMSSIFKLLAVSHYAFADLMSYHKNEKPLLCSITPLNKAELI